MPHRSRTISPVQVGIVAITLLAVTLGGSAELWSQATLALLAGILIFVAPPSRSLGPLNFIFPALFLLALAAFLPAAWFSVPPWRQQLADLPVVLPTTRTPQPWLTAQACALMLVGLVWIYRVLSCGWKSETRLQTARLLVLGIALLSAAAVAAYYLGFRVPGWTEVENRGWFPSRNQTADVLAVCGVVNYALVFDDLRKGRSSAALWILTLVLIAAGLVVSYSRSGIVMFFGGIVLWHLWPVQRHKVVSSSAKWTTLSLALALLLLTGFFLFGGDTLGRFEARPLSQSVNDAGFRIAIQKDAIHFSGEAPWLGVGLGNFEPLFASTQRESANGKRAIHPESDWLWAACELGWFAPLLFLAGIAWWLRRCLPFKHQTGESLRRAATVGALLFLLHGLVDVSGHRLASLGVGILLAGLALPRPRTSLPWRAGAIVFRMLAVLLMLIGGWWLASVEALPVPPTTADLARDQERIQAAVDRDDLATAKDLAGQALAIAPVNWHFYFQRAYAEAFLPGQMHLAGPDFLVARRLESQWSEPCFDEGRAWLAANEPDLCIDAWTEALRRAQPDERSDLLTRMMVLSSANEMVQDDLRQAVAGRTDEQLVFLSYASPAETKKIIADMLAQDPGLDALDSPARASLFGSWWDHGDRADLIAGLQAHAHWLDAGWPYLADAFAAQKDFERAWETISRYFPPPLMPTLGSDLSADQLEQSFYQTNNLTDGILLCLAQKNQGHTDDALATLRAVERIKGCPRYVFYLEAELWAARQQWEFAWNAWTRFQAS
jgi:hypothetical protein